MGAALTPRLRATGSGGRGCGAAIADFIGPSGRPMLGTKRRFLAGPAPAVGAIATATVGRPRSGCGGTTPRTTAEATPVAIGRRLSYGTLERGHCDPCAIPATPTYGRTSARARARPPQQLENFITTNASTK